MRGDCSHSLGVCGQNVQAPAWPAGQVFKPLDGVGQGPDNLRVDLGLMRDYAKYNRLHKTENN
jgi:hypothetical protein